MRLGKVIERAVVIILALAVIGTGYFVGETIGTMWLRQQAIINTVMINDYALERHLLQHGLKMTPIHGVKHDLVKKLIMQTVIVENHELKPVVLCWTQRMVRFSPVIIVSQYFPLAVL